MGRIRQTTRMGNLLRVLRVEGEIQAEEVWCKGRFALDLNPPLCVLWDFTSGSVAFAGDEADRSLNPLPRQAGPSYMPAKTALVCPNELDHGLFRILQVFSRLQRYPRELRVFRSEKPAWRWLDVCRWCRKARRTVSCRPGGCCISSRSGHAPGVALT